MKNIRFQICVNAKTTCFIKEFAVGFLVHWEKFEFDDLFTGDESSLCCHVNQTDELLIFMIFLIEFEISGY